MSDAVEQIARCGKHQTAPGPNEQAHIRRVLGLDPHEPIRPYPEPDPHDDSSPLLLGVVFLGLLGGVVGLVYAVSALLPWIW